MASGDLDLEKGADEPKPRGRGGRPTSEAKRSELAKELKESFLEVASILKEDKADEPEDLADTIRADAEKMANFCVAVAEKVPAIETVLRKLVGRSGPLYGARAFGPTARRLLSIAGEKRRDLFGDELVEEEPGAAQPGPDPYA